MKATMLEPKSWQRVFDVEIPEDEIESLAAEKQSKYRREIRLAGFRKGKVPAQIVQSRYGSAIRAEAIDDLVQKSYEQACKDNNIMPVSQAKLSDLKADKAGPVSFRIETEVDPEINIKNYKKLKIKASPRKIKDSEIDDSIKDLQERLAELKDLDREAKIGDLLTIEYEHVEIDGQVRTDFRNPSYPIELGAGKIKDFDKGFQGHRAGEIVDIKVKFPKDYGEQSVAGKTGNFTIKIMKVQEKILPELDQEFLRKIGDFTDMQALRERVRTDLESREADNARDEAYNKAIEQLIKNNPFDVPESRIQAYIDYMTEEAAKHLQPGQPAPSREEVAERYRESAIKTIKRYRIINYIADAEGIKTTQEEVDERIRQMAGMYNQEFEDLKQALRKNGTTNRIRADIREQKTLDFLIGELELPPAENV